MQDQRHNDSHRSSFFVLALQMEFWVIVLWYLCMCVSICNLLGDVVEVFLSCCECDDCCLASLGHINREDRSEDNIINSSHINIRRSSHGNQKSQKEEEKEDLNDSNYGEKGDEEDLNNSNYDEVYFFNLNLN